MRSMFLGRYSTQFRRQFADHRKEFAPDLFNSNVLMKYLSPSRRLILYILQTTCSHGRLKSYSAGLEPGVLYFAQGHHLRGPLFHVKYFGYSTFRMGRGLSCWWFDWNHAMSLVDFSFPPAAARSCLPFQNTLHDVLLSVLQVVWQAAYAQPLEKRTISMPLPRRKHIVRLGNGEFRR